MNPHDRNDHKILSLARLPVPTLPRICICRISVSDSVIIANEATIVNRFFDFFKLFFLLTYLRKFDKISFVRRSGGIGRRAGFRCLW